MKVIPETRCVHKFDIYVLLYQHTMSNICNGSNKIYHRVIINHYSMKDRQHNCQQKKTKANNYSQNHTIKIEELICSTCGTVVLL
jgi:hypothetical protein